MNGQMRLQLNRCHADFLRANPRRKSTWQWIVVPCGEEGIIRSDVELPSDDEIYAQIAFQEQFFNGVLVR